MRRLDWAAFRATEFPPKDPARAIAILPVAAIEQHGPHLPVGTDTMIMQGMLRRLEDVAPSELDLRILPVQAVGKSNEHLFAPGTATLTAETAIRAWTELGHSVARAGFRKMVIVNSHGGNTEIMGIVGRELRVRDRMLVGKCHWSAFGHPEGMYPDDELRFGIHGGDVETSLMLHFRPDLVDMDRARDFRSSAQSEGPPPVGPISYSWIATDLNAEGTVGNAAVATADKGAATCAHQVNGFVGLLRQLAAFDPARLSPETDAGA